VGRSSIKTTMGTCSHVIPGMHEEAAERLQGLLFCSTTPVALRSEEENAEKDRGGEQEIIPPVQGILGARSAGLEPGTF
jgi:hypothetical protein